MEQTWVDNGLTLLMKLYGCVATGKDVGMIEVVPDAATTAAIQSDEAGTLRGAFAKNPIRSWLDKHQLDDDGRLAARERFMRSCAAYCVASGVIGLGDRHPSNIMVTKTGELFHIDFGHFLGNFKSKLGVKRERSPFVFTPQMLGVLGTTLSDEVPQRFLALCHDAFNHLRRNAHLLLALFVLMVPAGMPELRRPSDVGYMHRMLLLKLDDNAAGKEFRQMISSSLKDTFRLLDNMIHMQVHRKK
jgi:phosphatidylinositol-4,5-bisphosphate 3-kinase